MRLLGTLLLALLGGCQADADTLALAIDDSLARQGLPVDRAGRARRGGARHRGGAAGRRPRRAAVCAISTASAMSSKPEQKESHARLSAYAAQYNQAHAGPLPAG